MTQGIWQTIDHRSITPHEARREWALHAHDVLEEVARRYGRSVTHGDLAAEVQRRSGICTDLDPDAWVDDVLEQVAERCKDSGEPRLIALVDRPGAGQADVVSAARMDCYSAYGAKIPAVKTPRRTTRARAGATSEPVRKPVKPEDRIRPICPRCFVEVPATGVCDSCD